MGPVNSTTWSLVLDGAESILKEEGYAALTSRRVAERVGIKQQLVSINPFLSVAEVREIMTMSAPSDRGERLIKIVRHWADIYEGICKRSPHTKITAADFDPITALVATDDFLRIGVFKDEADWPLCLAKYVQFAGTSLWSGKLRYINSVETSVFQELEETITRPHGKNVIYTMSVFEFNDDDKVRALRVYMQQAQEVANVLILGTEGK